MNTQEKLAQFITENNITAEVISFSDSVHTVKEAAEAVGTTPSSMMKSMVFLNDDQLIVGMVLGKDRVSTERICDALGLSEIRIANSKQVLHYTGYPIGGVPPFGYNALFIMDSSVMEKEVIYCGGGSSRALIRVAPETIVGLTNAMIERIRK